MWVDVGGDDVSDRTFLCRSCGKELDRDLNAGINVAKWANEEHAPDREATGRVTNACRETPFATTNVAPDRVLQPPLARDEAGTDEGRARFFRSRRSEKGGAPIGARFNGAVCSR